MTGFVDRRHPLLFVADDHRTTLRAHEHLVLGELEVEHPDDFLVVRAALSAASFTRFSRSARETRVPRAMTSRFTSSDSGIFLVWTSRIPTRPFMSGGGRYPAVEAARAKKRRVEHVRTVGGRDDDDAFVRLEPSISTRAG